MEACSLIINEKNNENKHKTYSFTVSLLVVWMTQSMGRAADRKWDFLVFMLRTGATAGAGVVRSLISCRLMTLCNCDFIVNEPG